MRPVLHILIDPALKAPELCSTKLTPELAPDVADHSSFLELASTPELFKHPIAIVTGKRLDLLVREGLHHLEVGGPNTPRVDGFFKELAATLSIFFVTSFREFRANRFNELHRYGVG